MIPAFRFPVILTVVMIGLSVPVFGEDKVPQVSKATPETEWRTTLQEALNLKQSLISVHAAESMVLLGDRDDVLARFQADRDGEVSAYQVAAWRVLARVEVSPLDRDAAVQKIRRVLLDPTSKFRVHAMESLAKLKAPILDDEATFVNEVASSTSDSGAPFALWRLAQTSRSELALNALTECLQSPDPVCQQRAAYTLWHLRPLPQQTLSTLNAGVTHADLPIMSRVLFALASDHEKTWELVQASGNSSARYFLALELAAKRNDESRKILNQLVGDTDLDVRAAAAFALLSHQTKSP